MNHGILTTTLFLLTAAYASAHPGHGSPTTENSIWHYVTSPLHALPCLLGLLVLAVIVKRVSSTMKALAKQSVRVKSWAKK